MKEKRKQLSAFALTALEAVNFSVSMEEESFR